MEIKSIVTMKSAQLSTILENHDIFDDKEVKLAARMLVKADKARAIQLFNSEDLYNIKAQNRQKGSNIMDYDLLSPCKQSLYRG